MKLYLVRHGQSKGNVDKSEYFKNLDCDIELTDMGKRDAIGAADRIMNLGDRINPEKTYNLYHSPYKRAYQTANIIYDRITGYEGYQINKFEESPLIREREWGNLRDIVTMGARTEDHFNFFYRPVNGESFADCYQRAVLFHQHILTTNDSENVIVVAHGEFNKMYMMYLLGWTVEECQKYKNSRNGEVFIIDTETGLSEFTTLSTSPYYKKK